jgi:deoxyribonuclease-4
MHVNEDEIGAHVSAAGGVQNAPSRAAALGATVFQLFTKQPSRWAEPEISPETANLFRSECRTHGIRFAAAHDSYLINLASRDAVLFARSRDSFRRELARCAAIGLDALVTHPGNATSGDVTSALDRNADAVAVALTADASTTMVLFELTAGCGTALGAKFEEIAYIIERLGSGPARRVGVCVDTCHLWAAGYDLANRYDAVFAEFDDTIGLDRIRLFHLNDSLTVLGSRRDRHAHIGEGALGHGPFRRLLDDDRFSMVPKVIETPKDDDVLAADRRNLATLRAYRMGARRKRQNRANKSGSA